MINYLQIVLLILPLGFYSCGGSSFIKEKPVSFSEKRIELTKEYIKIHYNIAASDISIEPKIIVLHWTAINDFDSCFNLFNMETLNGTRPDLSSSGQVNVSIQFLVDRDGTVYRLMPENYMARHCIGINYNSIGVENVGGAGSVDNLTDEQIEANVNLVEYLGEKYPGIEYLIGHHEYRQFENHPLWLEKDRNYRTVKYDPGERFMNAVRKGVKELKLKDIEELK
ncbi:MAG: N-acetylmuramoyl-L-alanine amidase [Ignavibacteria bacterium CG2_30_36_16]|nr:MAG: N-acetylmuramoyl-L-alanine amidase [Ignavibacteria bacterium CG2_30_36_16]PJA99229.1 MAG: N-acetylmuramoyl-L-alanine amidase [Ignavibacteria bacterium CG_4_9_14_3_um_filter_36_18]